MHQAFLSGPMSARGEEKKIPCRWPFVFLMGRPRLSDALLLSCSKHKSTGKVFRSKKLFLHVSPHPPNHTTHKVFLSSHLLQRTEKIEHNPVELFRLLH